MSGETEADVSGWTIDTLRTATHEAHVALDARISAIIAANDLRYQSRYEGQEKALTAALAAAEKAVSEALAAAEKAVIKAEVAAEKRFEAVNEFRGQLADQAATLMPRSEAGVQFKVLTDKYDQIARQLETSLAKESGTQSGVDLAAHQSDRTRALIFATIAAVASLAVIGLGIYAATGR